MGKAMPHGDGGTAPPRAPEGDGLETVAELAQLRARIAAWRRAGLRIGFVATMGALHEGHLSLVRKAHALADRVVVSIFLNPLQFAPSEDFASYPRDEAGDCAKLRAVGAHLVYLPSAEQMYPEGFATRVAVGGLSEGLCGRTRPQFFSGVATVVLKLFNQVRPDVSVFGEKDFQQLKVIERMVRDLDLDIEIVGAPIVRERDGLAMSSRNAYLSASERAIAPELYRTIRELAQEIAHGAAIDEAIGAGRKRLSALGFVVDYLEVRDSESLRPLTQLGSGEARVFVAATLGRTRLIDNVAIVRESQ